MPACIVKGCSFRWTKEGPNITLHTFPNNPDIIRAWLKQLKQDYGDLEDMCQKIMTSTKGVYRICCQHFTQDSYYQKGVFLTLKKEAVPTIFPDEAAVQADAERSTPRRWKKKTPRPDAKPSAKANRRDAGLSLKVIKVEQDDPLPISGQQAEPVTYPALISEDGYYISAESYIQKRKRVPGQGGGSRKAFPPKAKKSDKNTKYIIPPRPPRPKKTFTKKYRMRHKEVQTDICTWDKFLCRCQATSAPSTMAYRERIGKPGTRKGHVKISVACGPDSVLIVGPAEGLHSNRSPVMEHNAYWEQVGSVDFNAMEEDLSSTEIPVLRDPRSPAKEEKCFVSDGSLDRLLVQCRCLADDNCDGSILRLEKNVVGLRLSVKAECSNHHRFHLWDSRP